MVACTCFVFTVFKEEKKYVRTGCEDAHYLRTLGSIAPDSPALASSCGVLPSASPALIWSCRDNAKGDETVVKKVKCSWSIYLLHLLHRELPLHLHTFLSSNLGSERPVGKTIAGVRNARTSNSSGSAVIMPVVTTHHPIVRVCLYAHPPHCSPLVVTTVLIDRIHPPIRSIGDFFALPPPPPLLLLLPRNKSRAREDMITWVRGGMVPVRVPRVKLL